jgi:hypothetical protein
MDEAQLDEQFEQERERLENAYLTVLQSKHDDKQVDAAKESFERKYRALIVSYQQRQLRLAAHKRRNAVLKAPFQRLWSRAVSAGGALKQWLSAWRQVRRKRRFDRKIRRMLQEMGR